MGATAKHTKQGSHGEEIPLLVTGESKNGQEGAQVHQYRPTHTAMSLCGQRATAREKGMSCAEGLVAVQTQPHCHPWQCFLEIHNASNTVPNTSIHTALPEIPKGKVSPAGRPLCRENRFVMDFAPDLREEFMCKGKH